MMHAPIDCRPADRPIAAALPAADVIPHGRYQSVQIARALAALAVVALHADLVVAALGGPQYAHGLWQFGQAGVDLFFVISGFIIATVLSRPQSVGHFIGRRLLRILPFYWLFTVAWLIVLPLIGEPIPGPARMAASFLVLPQSDPPALGVGWSLEHEFIFYAIAAALLAVGQAKRLVAVMAAVAIASVAFAVVTGGQAGDGHHLLSLYQLQFLGGIAIHRWRREIAVLSWKPLVILGLSAFPLSAAFLHLLHGTAIPAQPQGLWGVARVMLWGLAAMTLLAGLIACEAQRPRLMQSPPARALIAVGGASYAIYLSHPLIIALFGLTLRDHWPAALPIAFAPWMVMLLSQAAGLLFFRYVERPVTDRLKI